VQVQVKQTGRFGTLEGVQVEEWEGVDEFGGPVILFVRAVHLSRVSAGLEQLVRYELGPDVDSLKNGGSTNGD